jgi:uroporphyrinogen-III synthase
VRIVLTRPEGRGEAFARALRAKGHEVLFAPLTRIEDLDPFPDPSAYDGVLFTSVAAVERAPARASWPRVGAVGEATAAALRARGIRVDVVGGGGGRELFVAWGAARGRRLLLPQAEGAHPDLSRLLREAGARVETVAVYRTVPLREVDRGALERADVIAFFAPSAVRAFLALGVATRARYFGGGPTTRAAMRAWGLEPMPEDAL